MTEDQIDKGKKRVPEKEDYIMLNMILYKQEKDRMDTEKQGRTCVCAPTIN